MVAITPSGKTIQASFTVTYMPATPPRCYPAGHLPCPRCVVRCYVRLPDGRYSSSLRESKPMSEPSGNRDAAWTSAEAAFFGALKELHLMAGEPSSRAIATAIGGISHTTVHAAIRGTAMPS